MLTRIADGVWIHQSEFIQSNGVVVHGSDGVLLIDPGVTGAELIGLADDLAVLRHAVVAGFSTHAHWDHLLWHRRLGGADRYGTARTAADIHEFLSAADWRDQVAEELPPEIEVPLDELGLITGLPSAATEIPWDGPRARIIEHRAHAAGHAALLIDERRVLVAGDMVSDVLIPMLDFRAADPIGDYLDGLTALEVVADNVDVFVPGHGSIGDARELLARVERDRRYMLALRDGGEHDDPRIGDSARPGWEWVSDVHAGQVQMLADRTKPS